MSAEVKYSFESKIWKYDSAAGWYFISLPESISKEIKRLFSREEEGWGRLKVIAEAGNTKWKTAIWYSKKRKTYFLPLKTLIREKEKLKEGHLLEINIII